MKESNYFNDREFIQPLQVKPLDNNIFSHEVTDLLEPSSKEFREKLDAAPFHWSLQNTSG
jgi:hypothetical protein